MKLYRKKPAVIEAVQYGDDNRDEILAWIGADSLPGSLHRPPRIFIYTLEGSMEAALGDWIIKGVKGEFYPCKPDIFEETYESFS